jgi:predicted phage tail component-like protein
MYEFRDTTAKVSEGNILPSEALMINGEYIENLIPGYRTLTVSGREALSPELATYETGIRDGSTLQNKRYPARIITVQYQLISESNEAFREAYNQLGSILNVEEAELIFNDEPDKFFTGTPSSIGTVPPGRNAVTGEFEIYCADPFKYSVVEYEATPTLEDGTILIDYNGTYKSFPTLEADFFNEDEASDDGETVTSITGNGDCGFVAFYNEEEKIIQLGDPDEADSESLPKSQTMFTQTFNKSSSWGTAAKSLWRLNNGKLSSSDVAQAGTVGMGVASYTTPDEPADTSGTLLKATSRADSPTFNYTVKAKATDRTASSVKVTVTVTAALGADKSYFGKGYELTVSVHIGGGWQDVKIKKTNDYWKGKTGHTINITKTITGLSASTTAITGIKFKATRPDTTGGTAGELSEQKCADLKISKYVAPSPETYYLTAKDYGSGSKWHGATITRTIPADKAGVVGAENFTLSFKNKTCIGTGKNASNEIGAFQAQVISVKGSTRRIIAGVNLYKGSAGNKAKLRFYVDGTTVDTFDVSITQAGILVSSVLLQTVGKNNFVNFSETSTITKVGSKVTFNVFGIKRTYGSLDMIVNELVANEVTFGFLRYGTKPGLTYNGLSYAKFVKNNCKTFKDIPNKFSANDIVEADCKNGDVYLNGTLAPDYGALGNDWEGFYLTPGLNQIGFTYSDWVEGPYAPSFKVKYREVFL